MRYRFAGVFCAGTYRACFSARTASQSVFRNNYKHGHICNGKRSDRGTCKSDSWSLPVWAQRSCNEPAAFILLLGFGRSHTHFNTVFYCFRHRKLEVALLYLGDNSAGECLQFFSMSHCTPRRGRRGNAYPWPAQSTAVLACDTAYGLCGSLGAFNGAVGVGICRICSRTD